MPITVLAAVTSARATPAETVTSSVLIEREIMMEISRLRVSLLAVRMVGAATGGIGAAALIRIVVCHAESVLVSHSSVEEAISIVAKDVRAQAEV